MRTIRSHLRLAAAATVAALLTGPAAWAAEGEHLAHPWQLNLQMPGSPTAERIHSFHDLLLWITTIVTLFVLALLVYTCLRFREDRNPVPSKRSHNALLEVVWTAVPVLILVVIAIPSFKLLYWEDVLPKADLTIKATGHQWYWSYEYPDNGNFGFDAVMVNESDLQPGQHRLLETDNRIIVPAGQNVRVLVTAVDVLHSWAVPSLGVKVDAVPGRLNELWFNAEQPGVYFGQCSELCGINHGFMPIAVEAVTKEAFDAWVAEAKTKFAQAPGSFDVASAAVPATPRN